MVVLGAWTEVAVGVALSRLLFASFAFFSLSSKRVLDYTSSHDGTNQYWFIIFKKIPHFFVRGASSPCNGNHFLVILLVRPFVRKERMRSEETQWISCVCSNQCLTTLSVRPYDDSEYNQPYCTKNVGKYIYKTKLRTQKKCWLFLSQIIDIDFLNTTSYSVQRTKASMYTKTDCKHRKNTGYFSNIDIEWNQPIFHLHYNTKWLKPAEQMVL